MGRQAGGWKLRWVRGEPGVGTAYVRFTYKGTRYDESTRKRDPVEAARAAAEIYAKVVSGVTKSRVISNATLEEATSSWLAEIESGYDEQTIVGYMRFANRWVQFFESIADMTDPGRLSSYVFARLKKSIRQTVLGELSAVNGFLGWAKSNRMIAAVPAMPEIPTRMTGTRTGTQRAVPVELSRDEVRELIAAIPEWSLPRGPDREPVDPKAVERLRSLTGSYRAMAATLNAEGFRRPRGGPWHHRQVERELRGLQRIEQYRVRAYFEFAYETSLRPETIWSIRVPRHWNPGGAYLEIENTIDKARFGRKLPLTERARVLLAEGGEIPFPKHHYYRYLKRAAAALGFSAQVAPYDFRHARATHLLEDTGNLPGVAFMLGHKRVTTTNRYAKANQKAAEAAIWGSDTGIKVSGSRKKAGGAS